MEKALESNYYPSLDTTSSTTSTKFALKAALAQEVLEQVRQANKGEIIETPSGITTAYFDVYVLEDATVLKPNSRIKNPVGYVLNPVNPDLNLPYEERHLVDWVDFKKINEVPRQGDIVVVKKAGSFAGELISVDVIGDDYQRSRLCILPSQSAFNDSNN